MTAAPPDTDDPDDADPVVRPDAATRCDGSVVLGGGSDESFDPTATLLVVASPPDAPAFDGVGPVEGGDALAVVGCPRESGHDCHVTVLKASDAGAVAGGDAVTLAGDGDTAELVVLRAEARADRPDQGRRRRPRELREVGRAVGPAVGRRVLTGRRDVETTIPVTRHGDVG